LVPTEIPWSEQMSGDDPNVGTMHVNPRLGTTRPKPAEKWRGDSAHDELSKPKRPRRPQPGKGDGVWIGIAIALVAVGLAGGVIWWIAAPSTPPSTSSRASANGTGHEKGTGKEPDNPPPDPVARALEEVHQKLEDRDAGGVFQALNKAN